MERNKHIPVADCGTFLTRFHLLLVSDSVNSTHVMDSVNFVRLCVNFNGIDFVYDNTAYGQCAILS